MKFPFNKNYIYLTSLVFLLLFITLSSYITNQKTATTLISEPKIANALKQLYPEAKSFSYQKTIPPHYKVYQSKKDLELQNLLGLAFNTEQSASDVIGYAGPIHMLIGLNLDGTIKGIKILAHQETPSHIKQIDAFMQQFNKQKINQSFILGKNIDGMTRATVTSQAICSTLEKSAISISNNILHISASTQNKAQAFPLEEIVIPLLIFILALRGIQYKTPLLRWLSLFFSLAYFGFIKASMFSVIQIGNISLLNFPSILKSPLWFALLFLTIITLLMFGNVYCGSICPFGGLQEIIFILGKGLRNQKRAPSTKMSYKARKCKVIILFAALLLCFYFQSTDIIVFEPYILFFTFNASLLGWFFVSFLFITSAFDYRFWCKYLCPIGGFNGIIALCSRKKIVAIKQDTCGQCHRCTKICPTEAIYIDDKHQTKINFSECILCGKCLRKCPKNHIVYQ